MADKDTGYSEQDSGQSYLPLTSSVTALRLQREAHSGHPCPLSPVSCPPSPPAHFHANFSPVTFSNASIYLARVLATTSAGSSGGGLFLSQPVCVSQSRTNCLSNDGCPRPG